MLGVMDELFSPAFRHTVEEIAGKKHSRVDLSAGDDEWIDLDGGKVYLSRPVERCARMPFVPRRTGGSDRQE